MERVTTMAHGGDIPAISLAVEANDFDDFYAASFQGLALQLYAYLGDLAEAQDVTQEAFCRAYVKWGQVSHYEQPGAWVRRVAWNLATSHFRRRAAALNFMRGQREQYVAEPTPDRVALTFALAQIPDKQRRAIVLHYLAQLSILDIAAEENVPEGTVKSWLSRGRTALAALLRNQED